MAVDEFCFLNLELDPQDESLFHGASSPHLGSVICIICIIQQIGLMRRRICLFNTSVG